MTFFKFRKITIFLEKNRRKKFYIVIQKEEKKDKKNLPQKKSRDKSVISFMNYKDIGKPNEFLDFQEDILKECLNSNFIHFDFEKPEIR